MNNFAGAVVVKPLPHFFAQQFPGCTLSATPFTFKHNHHILEHGYYLGLSFKCDYIRMQFNWLVTALAALIPMLIGMIWYSKMLFGNTWMRINRFREEDMKSANMAVIFGFTLLFSFMIAIVMNGIVIHQFTLYSLIGGEATTPADKAWIESSMSTYGHKFRSFKHGVLHGSIASVMFALPVLGIPALFERRGWKYIVIHFGYWLVTLALMGGVICQWA